MSFPETINGQYARLALIELRENLILSKKLYKSHVSLLGIRKQNFTSTGVMVVFANAIPTEMIRFHRLDD